MANEVAKQNANTPMLSKYTNTYLGILNNDLTENSVNFDSYSKQCVVSCMQSIFEIVTESNIDMKNIQSNNIKDILTTVACLKINSNAHPKECYLQVRSKKVGNNWTKKLELGIEGDGNDAILRNFGVNVKTVHPYWLVRENDEFEYPSRVGIEVKPPSWVMVDVTSKVDKVVYPIETLDGNITYQIAERNGTKPNLVAHIRNNMMNETFGVCENRYKATDKQKVEIAKKKEEVLEKVLSFETVDEILDCKELKPYISMAWLDSREAMIERKMRNNAIRKFPKDLGSALANKEYNKTDETFIAAQNEIEENENTTDFDEAVQDAECTQID